MGNDKKLFLLDAMALIYRAYFAFSNNHRINSKGLNTSAIFGFTNTLLEVLKKEKPTHLAVVFDTAAPTSRHEDFSEYKANRQEMPEDISKAIPWIIKLIEGFNIPVLALDGYEADDLIGTLAKKAEKKGFTTYMMTPDKDFGQLVSDHIYIYKPARLGNGAEVLGIPEVCKRWEIKNVDQVRDILGLMGDSVDNIPGVPGVGEKTAMQLVKDYGNVETLLKNTDKLKGMLKEKVENNKELAIQSKRLATIICDAPVDLNEEKLQVTAPNRDALRELFAELEFRRLAEQILGDASSTPAQNSETGKQAAAAAPEKKNTAKPKAATGQTDLFSSEANETVAVDEGTSAEFLVEESNEEPAAVTYETIQTVPHEYHVADTPDKRKKLIEHLEKQSLVCFDTETTGLDTLQAELVGISFSYKKHEAHFVPMPEDREQAKKVVHEFKSFFENETIEKAGQNMKYDISVLKNYDVEVKGKYFDTMIAHYLIRPEMRHGMDALSQTYLKYSPVPIEALIGKKGKEQLSMRSVPAKQLAEYAAEDADVTFQLHGKFAPMLKEVKAEKLFHEIEIPLIRVLSAMEAEGIRVDIPALKEFSLELEKDILNIDKEIQQMAGTSFNIASPKQVGEVLFEVMKIVEKPKKTKTGQYATGEDVLIKLAGKHPIVGKILDYRELQKLKNTYVDTLPTLVNPRTGKIHTTYNQVVAVTGRLSSDNPNLQNIPIRTARGREVRKAFVPRNDDYLLFSADYSQIELRIIAALSGDEGMVEAFNSGMDIHAATAAKVYSVAPEAVTSDMRRNAKMVNFGIIYGISAFGLAERLNIPRKEAATVIEQYFIKYPRIKDYMDETIEQARKQGYVETIKGRRRYLREINSANATVRGYAERNAINAPIQGSAADMIKIAMVNIHEEFIKRKFKSRMLLQVHDELVFDLYKKEAAEVKAVVEEKMKTAIEMSVPIEVETGTGKNWLEAH